MLTALYIHCRYTLETAGRTLECKCPYAKYNNDICDYECNRESCGWDGGDCKPCPDLSHGKIFKAQPLQLKNTAKKEYVMYDLMRGKTIYMAGANLIYTCTPGYALALAAGAANPITCKIDTSSGGGTSPAAPAWTAKPPTCEAVTCSPPLSFIDPNLSQKQGASQSQFLIII